MRIATYKVTDRETGAEMVVNATDFDKNKEKYKRVTADQAEPAKGDGEQKPADQAEPAKGSRKRDK